MAGLENMSSSSIIAAFAEIYNAYFDDPRLLPRPTCNRDAMCLATVENEEVDKISRFLSSPAVFTTCDPIGRSEGHLHCPKSPEEMFTNVFEIIADNSKLTDVVFHGKIAWKSMSTEGKASWARHFESYTKKKTPSKKSIRATPNPRALDVGLKEYNFKDEVALRELRQIGEQLISCSQEIDVQPASDNEIVELIRQAFSQTGTDSTITVDQAILMKKFFVRLMDNHHNRIEP